MRNVARVSLSLLCVALLGAPAAARAEAPAEPHRLVIGLIPEMNIFKQKARFKLLGEYVSRKIGVPVQLRVLSRYGNLIDSFQQGRMDGAFFGSFTGALAIERLGVIPLARPVNLDGASTYHAHVFVRKDTPYRSIADLRGKRMAFVDHATTAGYVFPLALLRESGISDERAFFGESWFTGSHDAAIAAVLEGKADAGAAKNTVYQRLREADPRVDRELRVLADSPPVPSNGLCVRPGLPPALVERLKQALLSLDKEPEGAEVLKQFGALRFIETTVADYAPVIEMTRKAGIDLKRYEYVNQ